VDWGLGNAPYHANFSEAMAEITIYTTEPCSFCARTKALLKARGLDYREVNLSKDPTGRLELVQRTGMMTFPQVLVEDTLIGGFAETLSAVENGRFDELLAA
jgi:glutaredoxin 3